MHRLRVDDVLELLPDLDELRPLIDGILATSTADPERRWTVSGELATVGQRLVSSARLEAELPAQLEELRDHMSRIYGGLATAVRTLEQGDRAGAARALVDVAETEEAAGRAERAESYARAAYATARGERSREVAIHALRVAARAARTQGALERAAGDYEAAFHTAVHAREERHARISAIGRGNVAVDRGRWEEAEQWYRRALDRMTDDGTSSAERWHVLVDLSIAARQLGDLDACTEWLTRAEDEARAMRDDAAAATLANAWGLLHHARGRLDEAEVAFRGALEHADSPKARVTISVNLAEALLERDRWLDAAEAARAAEAAALRHRVVTKLPEVYRILGRIAAAQGQDDALVFFERALDVIRDRALPDFERALTLEAYAACTEDPAVARSRLEEAAAAYGRIGNESRRARLLASIRPPSAAPEAPEGA